LIVFQVKSVESDGNVGHHSIGQKLWARRKKRVTNSQANEVASEKVARLADVKIQYYADKMQMKREQHERDGIESQKRLKVLDLQEQYYFLKLKKLSEE
jgi:hypothetical protein